MEKTYTGIEDGKEIVIKVEQDEGASSPREWENIGEMICFYKGYQIGDEHDYRNPREFLEDVASKYFQTKEGQQYLEKKAEEHFKFVVAKLEYDKDEDDDIENLILLVPEVIFQQEDTESFDTLERAKERILEKRADIISDKYIERTQNISLEDELKMKQQISTRTKQATDDAVADETIVTKEDFLDKLEKQTIEIRQQVFAEFHTNVLTSVRKEVNNTFSYEIVEFENRFYMVNMNIECNRFEDEAFDTKEEAEERLKEVKNEWIEADEHEELTNGELLAIIKKDHVILPLYLYEHGGMTMNTSGFSCEWDSGQVGWIYASKQKFMDETGYSLDELFNTDIHRIPVAGERVKVRGHEEKGNNGFGVIADISHGMATVNFDYHKCLEARKEENLVTVPLYEILEVQANQAEEALKNEVKVYDYYLTDEVYWYSIEEDGEQVESCGGFFGSDMEESGMLGEIPSQYHHILNKTA